MKIYLRWTIAATLILGLTTLAAVSGPQVRTIPTEAKPGKPTSKDSAATAATMRAKLSWSQQILEGLVTEDFVALEQGAAALSEISLSPPPSLAATGDRSDEEVYEHFRMEFARLSGQLQGHARRKELEASAWVMQNLTATCISCHDYIRDRP